jgi:hypothetical protein
MTELLQEWVRGTIRGLRDARLVLDVEDGAGYSDPMRCDPVYLPTPDMLPMTKLEREAWLGGYAKGITYAVDGAVRRRSEA